MPTQKENCIGHMPAVVRHGLKTRERFEARSVFGLHRLRLPKPLMKVSADRTQLHRPQHCVDVVLYIPGIYRRRAGQQREWRGWHRPNVAYNRQKVKCFCTRSASPAAARNTPLAADFLCFDRSEMIQLQVAPVTNLLIKQDCIIM